MKSIEDVITRMEVLIKANIQTYIDTMNTTYTDYIAEDYIEEAFKTWELFNKPPYQVFYLLAPTLSNPVSTSVDYGGTSLKYNVLFMVGIRQNGIRNMLRLSHRYLKMIIDLFNEKVLQGFNSTKIVDARVLTFQFEDEEEEFSSPSILIEVPIAY